MREGRQRFGWSPDVKLVGIARPAAQGLDEMIWDPITRSNRGGSNAKTVRGEISWNLGRCHNLPEPICQARASKRLPIGKQKQGARCSAP